MLLKEHLTKSIFFLINTTYSQEQLKLVIFHNLTFVDYCSCVEVGSNSILYQYSTLLYNFTADDFFSLILCMCSQTSVCSTP